ncbi:hypothetical protein LY71_11050 [Geodermatophilus tzadiensis]|uniref:4-amino-4-deoxy-L-arabinose transferase-like glycosyltransferase n=1 Tax=Geodermatophilus tzadiensis TaxID=1137988 RepID=A0A2T0TR13_9ACTN|nr:hypothetical protein [Geodermatophilus tzadiensis]PRY48164.1 hypothetical protein LY71_11050 [Geodermatophilus tzadiensis]
MTRAFADAGTPDALPASASGGTPRRERASLVRRALAPLVVLAGLASWAGSLTQVDTATRSDYGLLALVGPLFYAGLALLCAGFVLELFDQRRTWVLVAGVVGLVAVIDATVPILYTNPEYAWTYKHLGVVEWFREGNGVTDPRDIYQQWPALFTAVAALGDLTGVSTLTLAAWAPFASSLLVCLPVFAIARTLSEDRRVAFLTVFLFHAGLWVGTAYLSPQAYAFHLSLGCVLVVLAWLRRTPTEWRRGPSWLRRLKAWTARGAEPVTPVAQRSRWAALALLYVLFATVTIAHQLSPYMLVAAFVLLTALGTVRPRWTVLGCLVIAVAYLLPRFEFINSAYGLLDSLRFWENAGGVVSTTTGTAGQVFTSTVASALALGIWLAGALAVLVSWRTPGRVLVPAALAFAPFLILLGQSYGGEAIYRVYLFSLPFTAFLIAQAVLRIRWARVLAPALAVVLVAVSLASIQGLHGTLAWSTFSEDEVAAMRWLYENGEQRSTLVIGAQNAPGRLTADYNAFGVPSSGGDPDLITFAGLGGELLDEGGLPAVEEFMATQGERPYLVITRSMVEYSEYYGLVADGSLQRLEEAVAGAPGWTTEYENDDALIVRFEGGAP